FYFLLFTLPACKSYKTFKILGGVTLIILIFTGWPKEDNYITVSVPSSSNIATVKINNEGRSYLINCSSNQIVREFFHRDLDGLILPDVRADHIRSLESLLDNSNVHEIIIFRKPTAYLKRILDEKKCSHLLKIYSSHRLIKEIEIAKDKYEINFQDIAPGKNKVNLKIIRNQLSTTTISTEIESANSKAMKEKFSFSYSNNGYLKQIKF
ncbi:MAG: hypothetical protein NE327_16520, partial [Lentisphaeraceae bacterium]|nr:hypothetical protein [Lentisphaeraceae bacterium]